MAELKDALDNAEIQTSVAQTMEKLRSFSKEELDEW